MKQLFFALGAFACLGASAHGHRQASSLSGEDMCGNERIAAYPSPDGRISVVVFERDCGATTDFSTQASLLPASEVAKGAQVHGVGNLFVADSDHGAAPRGKGGGPELRVTWIDNHQLVLSHHRAARVFMAVRVLSGVHVRYDTFDVPPPRKDPASPTAPVSSGR